MIKYILPLLLLIMISCNNESKKEIAVELIDFQNSFEKKEELCLSDIAQNIDYIPLSSNKNSLLGKINKVKVFENIILISDNTNSLFVYNINGLLINKIKNLGRGPGEYIEITDFTFLKEKNLIAIYSRLTNRQIFLYSMNGDYINSLPNKLESDELIFLNNKFFCYTPLIFRRYSDYSSISVLSMKGGIEDHFLHKEEEKSFPSFYNNLGDYSFFKFKNQLVFWEKSFNDGIDTVWNINPSIKKLTPRFLFKTGGEKIPIDRYAKNGPFTMQEYMNTVDVFKYNESTNYVFCRARKFDYINSFVYNKELKSLKNIFFEDSQKPKFEIQIKNDIDGGIPFWPEGKISDNVLFKITYGYEIKEYLERQGNNFTVKNLNSREHLLNLTKHSNINDNPILMLVTFKESEN